MTPAKEGETGNAITSSDALAIMQSTAFVRELTPRQKIAADVDGSGLVSGADALAVLRYSAFHTTAIASTGQWLFDPSAKEISVTGQMGLNFLAYVLGDVTGNWQPNGLSKVAQIQPLEVLTSYGENGAIDISLFCARNRVKINSLGLTIHWLVNSETTPEFVPAKQQQFVLNTENAGKSHLALASIDGFEPGDKIGHLSIATSEAFAEGVNLGNVTNISVDDSAAPDIEIHLNATGVNAEKSSSLPEELTLLQNYPNPFNMQTIIPYAIPAKLAGSQIKISVLNLQGQTVDTIFEGQAEAGNHQSIWSGKDGRGRDLTSGTYLYQLRIGKMVRTRKLLLLK